MLKNTLRMLLAVLAVAAVLVSASANAAILNETTFNLSGGTPIETITDGGGAGFADPQNNDTNFSPASDTINGWIHYIENSNTNVMTFAPGSDLATDAPSGVGEAQLGSNRIATQTRNNITADVINFDFGGAGTISGIGQTFDSLGGEVTITVGWHRQERYGSGLAIVDGTGLFGDFDYTYQNSAPSTYTHTFTPTESQFSLFFASQASSIPGGGNRDTNGTLDYVKVEQVADGGGGAVPGVILETGFNGRTVSGDTAGNITYTLNGVADPGDLTAVETQEGDAGNQLAGLFDTGSASSHFAPDLNTDNEDNWSVSIPLSLTAPSITIDAVVLDGDHFTNTGGFQGANRDTDMIVEILDSTGNVIATETKNSGNVTTDWTLAFFDTTAPILLDNSETWTLRIGTTNFPNNSGNNTGLDGLSVIGLVNDAAVPEPSTFALAALGLLGMGLLVRRKKKA